MSRYRKVDVRIWSDEEFRKLSKPTANGQSLFHYCLTGPFTTNIPGLFSAGEAAMAERLGWPLKDFREAFREVSSKPLVKADWKAHLVFVPNAIKYNVPQNPNVVKGWADVWDELPECALKAEAYQNLKSFLEGFTEVFGKAFTEACRKHSPNQEQEQEQEQEQKQEQDAHPAAPVYLNGSQAGFQSFWTAFPKKRNKGDAEKAWFKLKPDDVLLGTMLSKIEQATHTPDWKKEDGAFIPYPASWLNAKGWEDEYAVSPQRTDGLVL